MHKTISISELQRNMFEIFHELEESGETLIVTDGDVSILRIAPIDKKGTVDEIFAGFHGRVVYHEDLDVPTTDGWEAN